MVLPSGSSHCQPLWTPAHSSLLHLLHTCNPMWSLTLLTFLPEKQIEACSPCPGSMWTQEWAWKGWWLCYKADAPPTTLTSSPHCSVPYTRWACLFPPRSLQVASACHYYLVSFENSYIPTCGAVTSQGYQGVKHEARIHIYYLTPYSFLPSFIQKLGVACLLVLSSLCLVQEIQH